MYILKETLQQLSKKISGNLSGDGYKKYQENLQIKRRFHIIRVVTITINSKLSLSN